MNGPGLTLHRAEKTDLDDIERLLSRNDLPTADVRAKSDCFYVATLAGERVGIGGIESPGTAGLLRSVVVERAVRGRGVGGALVEALVDRAKDEGIGTLYLLTTDAAGFFTAQGFEQIGRERVPDPVRETEQFASLCPASATVMRRSLSRRHPS